MAIVAMLSNLDIIITFMFNLLFALMKIDLLSEHPMVVNGVFYKRGANPSFYMFPSLRKLYP